MKLKLMLSAVGLSFVAVAPIGAIAGGGHAWTAQGNASETKPLPTAVRDWYSIDTNRDHSISAEEMETYLQGFAVRSAEQEAKSTQNQSRHFDVDGDGWLSSTELGMKWRHAADQPLPLGLNRQVQQRSLQADAAAPQAPRLNKYEIDSRG